MDSWLQDLRFGARSVLRHRAVSTLALLTLALGIGANTAIFSVVNGVVLEPLPMPQPDRLVMAFSSAPKLGYSDFGVSPPDFKDWLDQARVFSGLDAMRLRRFTLTGGDGEPQAFAGAAVTGGFFRTLGIKPLAGRLLAPLDDLPSSEPTVVLGVDLWHQRFGGDPGIVHRQITIDGRPHTVVGVAPRTFDFPRRLELWVPLALDEAKESRGARYLHVLGRLKPGVDLGRAQSDMSTIASRLERQYPDQDAGWGVALTRLDDLLLRDIRPALAMLQAAAWAVLLIAAANVANLLLARLGTRELEIAVRAALGAGRLRLVRQIVAESVILSGIGGAIGLVAAYWGTRWLVALDPDAIPRAEGIGIDGRVLAYTLLISVVTGLVFGLLPALSAAGGRLEGALREGRRQAGDGRRARLARDALVLGEVALALMLLIGAGLLLQSFARLQAVDPGFSPKGVLTARLSLPVSRYPAGARQAAFFQQLLDRIETLPGVRQAASIDRLPLADANLIFSFVVEGRPPLRLGENQSATGHFVSSDYFRAMKISLLQGRPFGTGDRLEGPAVAIVNQAMAARIWPRQNPLGQRIGLGGTGKPDFRWLRVVGVVHDVRVEGLGREPEMEIYRPLSQVPTAAMVLVVRTTADPWRLVAPIRHALRQLDGELPLDRVQTMEQIIAWSLAEDRVKSWLLGVFAALALVLAAVGVYGVVSYSVTQRVREIGIRMALGARSGEVVRMLVRQGMTPVVIGLAAGLAGARAVNRLIAGQLFGVGIADPLTYAGVAIALGLVAMVAGWLPARRATRVDPLAALRDE